MIEFITLFLGGLVTGPQQIEIMAGDAVAIVEVWLDGELEQRLNTSPWKLEVDFGSELSPHALEAVALDGNEQELARTRQWINMSSEPAQSVLVVEGVERGQEAVARLSWESLGETNEPDSVEVHFDGLRLAADDPRSIQLPTFDPSQPHHLRVRLEFTGALISEAEAVFGGSYGSQISSEISAVPIRFDKGRKPKSAQTMHDWFLVGGEPQKVHAVEKGPAEIIVVRDVAAMSRLAKLAAEAAQLESETHLKKNHRLSFISPCPIVHPRDEYHQVVHPHTQRFSSKDGSLLRLIAFVVPANCTEQRQQLADAVGVAGLLASGDGSRRVVLLLISGEPRDQSAFAPAQVVSYLERLRVPLFVWRLGPADELETSWGKATNVRKLGRFDKAFNLLEKDLERQLIVWLEGLHLPQSVELRPDVKDISLLE